MNNILCLDFDNVISDSGAWQDGPITALPKPLSLPSIKKLTEQGYECVVFTARQDLDAVREWLALHHFPDLDVTNQKLPARAYIDDRGIRFTNWDDIVRYFL